MRYIVNWSEAIEAMRNQEKTLPELIESGSFWVCVFYECACEDIARVDDCDFCPMCDREVCSEQRRGSLATLSREPLDILADALGVSRPVHDLVRRLAQAEHDILQKRHNAKKKEEFEKLYGELGETARRFKQVIVTSKQGGKKGEPIGLLKRFPWAMDWDDLPRKQVIAPIVAKARKIDESVVIIADFESLEVRIAEQSSAESGTQRSDRGVDED